MRGQRAPFAVGLMKHFMENSLFWRRAERSRVETSTAESGSECESSSDYVPSGLFYISTLSGALSAQKYGDWGGWRRRKDKARPPQVGKTEMGHLNVLHKLSEANERWQQRAPPARPKTTTTNPEPICIKLNSRKNLKNQSWRQKCFYDKLQSWSRLPACRDVFFHLLLLREGEGDRENVSELAYTSRWVPYMGRPLIELTPSSQRPEAQTFTASK